VHHKAKIQTDKLLKTQKARSSNKATKKVILIGDSHTRNCAFSLQDNLNNDYKFSLQDNLNNDYKVTSFVKLGAKISEIVKTTSEELKSLKDGDIVILWGGSNDTGENYTNETLNLFMEFVTKHKELNIVIVNSPHRYDLVPTSCVNLEVEKFNRKLNKIMKLQTNVTTLILELETSHFTNHGLHLNFKGKNVVSQNLASVVKNRAAKGYSVLIPAAWTVPSPIAANEVNNAKQESNNSEDRSIPFNSSRLRRNCPSRRDPDFLWS
jgi:lysophospholipase L1-like esterase